MEFIARSAEPAYLSESKEKWVKPWVDYYRKTLDKNGKLMRVTKPTDNHWTHDEIRKKLILDFNNNCGYCGCSRPMPQVPGGLRSQRGHVDHYRAKALYPELTYQWDNYIWSCESCNTEKGEFDDQDNPIFNPCEENDCNQLIFINDTGEYCLVDQEGSSDKRFINTDRSIMLNAPQITCTRRNRVKALKSLFQAIDGILEYASSVPLEHIISDNIANIKNDLEDESFYFLMQKNYSELRSQYPSVAKILDA